jgi:hypothetical protein
VRFTIFKNLGAPKPMLSATLGERRYLGEVQSAPCADNSADFAAANLKRQIKISGKVGENAKGSAAAKADLMRDSDALLTLVGSIIHGYHEYWRNSRTKQHYKVHVQSRFTIYLIQVLPSAHDQHMELSSETISNWNKCGIVAADEEAKHR